MLTPRQERFLAAYREQVSVVGVGFDIACGNAAIRTDLTRAGSPDLVNRLTAECVRTAQSVLAMCIRATDYLPPVDPTFSDFLRAMVTADFELNRADDSGLRASMMGSKVVSSTERHSRPGWTE